ncbi:Glycerol-3-phosphate ABC transporter, permease protein UgpA [Marinobacterium lacunae]|uniref:sn-glycerol-3-phosphate transport system permease protein UgpA n=1 Tax=Marinobacterium lacunae TaxID=1232683 RepID=A0A081G1T1_9GAMM|nr:sn-glycerol-3-phosphate ABC transporter permease UgpA [Marinobacterium lacunae]KEA64736.1 Glycerol-3-phosphate ABC transporter, permease protein UgpA [Marinobacterium lacunae]
MSHHSNIPAFNHRFLPWILMAPQLLVTLVFFIWPAGQAVWQSFLVEDAFGLSTEFVWFENYAQIFTDSRYYHTLWTTIIFSAGVTLMSMGVSLLLAVMADQVVRGAQVYKTLLIWPYAVAPAVAGVLWLFMFHPTVGVLAYMLDTIGIEWNHFLDGDQALLLVIIAAAWKQISYNFLFFLAGLQAIPQSLHEAAAIDGAGPGRRFFTITFPLLSPTTFFLLVVNVVYAFFDTFGIIHAVTKGGPGDSTRTLVYNVFDDGFVGLDLGGSAAQSVVLMVLVGLMTVVQFRFVERKVQY